ncbi:hypothetical protein GW17_00041482 [Ensete ventricosum]|nr:hypothetical protein GW17_00041482 [Ensete ventricosum]RZR80396.1 hypothetical protein BHM03_00006419 [Ensete ventricosum]
MSRGGDCPTRNLFMTCFRLCKGQGGYYKTASSGFRVSGAPSNNKDIINLKILKGMSHVLTRHLASSPAREAPASVTEKRPAKGEVMRPKKRTKSGTRKRS